MRGLSPIIAVVLLILMTVAAAGAAYIWIMALQKKMSGSANQQMQVLNTGMIQYVSASCDSSNNMITTIIRNVGKTIISSGNVTLELKDSASNAHLNTFYNYSNSLTPGGIVTYNFNASKSTQSLESKTTTLVKDTEYTLTITMPDGSYDVTTCTAS